MKKQLNYLICAVLILVIALFVSWRGGLFSADTARGVFRILADSFFVPGVLFMGCGLLGFASSKGTYDMISFGFGRMMRYFVPMMDKRKYDDFYKYKQRRDEDGRAWKPFLFISGAVAFSLSLLFTVLYYAV